MTDRNRSSASDSPRRATPGYAAREYSASTKSFLRRNCGPCSFASAPSGITTNVPVSSTRSASTQVRSSTRIPFGAGDEGRRACAASPDAPLAKSRKKGKSTLRVLISDAPVAASPRNYPRGHTSESSGLRRRFPQMDSSAMTRRLFLALACIIIAGAPGIRAVEDDPRHPRAPRREGGGARRRSSAHRRPALARAQALAAALANTRVRGGDHDGTRAHARNGTAARRGAGPDARDRAFSGARDAHASAVADAVRAHAGRTVLVVGHSNTIPAIIAALGGPKLPDICDTQYSNLFVLVVKDERARSSGRRTARRQPDPPTHLRQRH